MSIRSSTRRKRAVTVLFALSVLIVAGAAVVVVQGQPRVLAQRDNPDGSSTIVVGKPRLCGLLGIEIVQEERNLDGTVTYASVQDLLGSWKEAIRRYKDPDGGGLLAPLDDH